MLLTALIWGFGFVAQCDAADKIDPFLFTAIRFLLGSISLLPVIFLFENKNEKKAGIKPEYKKIFLSGGLCGTVLFLASMLQQLGINLDPSAGKSGFITGIYTVLVPIFCLILFKKKTDWNVWAGALCAVVGLYLLSFSDGYGAVGKSDLVLLLGSVCWAFHIICIDKCIGGVSPLKFSSVQFFVCSLLAFVFTLIFGNVAWDTIASQFSNSLVAIFYAGVCSSGIAYTLQALGQKDADPTYAAIILSLESVFAAIGGVIFGIDESMTFKSYLGCFIIFVGIIVSQVSPKQLFEKKKNQ